MPKEFSTFMDGYDCNECRNYEKQELRLRKRIKELEEELIITNKLLDTRNKLLESIPACEEHGKQCVQHAIDWVKKQLLEVQS